MIHEFKIKVEGFRVVMQTDNKRFDALDRFIMALLFVFYRKNNPERLQSIVTAINAQYANLSENKPWKKQTV